MNGLCCNFFVLKGAPFRGDHEVFGSKHNSNFLGILELISQFDPFFAKHIEDFGNAGRGKPSYLSATVSEEFIEIMAQCVRDQIIREIQHQI